MKVKTNVKSGCRASKAGGGCNCGTGSGVDPT
jgi:hypothetical protein